MKNTEAEAACSDAREGVSRCKHSNYGGCVLQVSYNQWLALVIRLGYESSEENAEVRSSDRITNFLDGNKPCCPPL